MRGHFATYCIRPVVPWYQNQMKTSQEKKTWCANSVTWQEVFTSFSLESQFRNQQQESLPWRMAVDINAYGLWTESRFDLPSWHRWMHAHKRGPSEMGAVFGFVTIHAPFLFTKKCSKSGSTSSEETALVSRLRTSHPSTTVKLKKSGFIYFHPQRICPHHHPEHPTALSSLLHPVSEPVRTFSHMKL